MSDTPTTDPVEPEGSQPIITSMEREAGNAETTAPEGQAAAVETEAGTTQEPEPKAKPDRVDRRLATLTAKLAAAERGHAELLAKVEALRNREPAADPNAPLTAEDIPRIVEERVKEEVARRATQERAERFHEAGRAAHADWAERCQNLMQMGADGAFSELLIDMTDGAKVAGALADDPEELERITGLRTERARAIALGKYAATLEDKPAARPRVSRAPDPIRPVNGGTARATFDERRATVQQLVDHYRDEAMAKRRGQMAGR